MPGTIGGSFIVDYLGPKWTTVLEFIEISGYPFDLEHEISGLLFQAFIGFIMSGLYKQYVSTALSPAHANYPSV